MRLELDPESAETEKAVAEDLMEVFKYALKFNAMTFEDRREAFEKLQGKRMVSAFGAFYGIKLEDEFGDDLEALEMEPYIRLVYAAIGIGADRAYRLKKSEQIEPAENGVGVVEVGMDVGQAPAIDGEYV
jgi:hypothetical protein